MTLIYLVHHLLVSSSERPILGISDCDLFRHSSRVRLHSARNNDSLVTSRLVFLDIVVFSGTMRQAAPRSSKCALIACNLAPISCPYFLICLFFFFFSFFNLRFCCSMHRKITWGGLMCTLKLLVSLSFLPVRN